MTRVPSYGFAKGTLSGCYVCEGVGQQAPRPIVKTAIGRKFWHITFPIFRCRGAEVGCSSAHSESSPADIYAIRSINGRARFNLNYRLNRIAFGTVRTDRYAEKNYQTGSGRVAGGFIPPWPSIGPVGRSLRNPPSRATSISPPYGSPAPSSVWSSASDRCCASASFSL